MTSLVDKWAKALESGKYEQIQEELKGYIYDESGEQPTDKVGYCCLGVLREIAPKRAKIEDSDGTLLTPQCFEKVFELRRTKEVKEKNISIRVKDPDSDASNWYEDESYVQNILAKMNDQGNNFKQIAEWIRKNLKDRT